MTKPVRTQTRTPLVPHITAVHTNIAQVSRIEKTVVGEDLQSGLVAKVQKLEVTRKILVALGSASLTALVALAYFLFERLIAS
jgi:hypothetical protein